MTDFFKELFMGGVATLQILSLRFFIFLILTLNLEPPSPALSLVVEQGIRTVQLPSNSETLSDEISEENSPLPFYVAQESN